jgi:hypothetical protein
MSCQSVVLPRKWIDSTQRGCPRGTKCLGTHRRRSTCRASSSSLGHPTRPLSSRGQPGWPAHLTPTAPRSRCCNRQTSNRHRSRCRRRLPSANTRSIPTTIIATSMRAATRTGTMGGMRSRLQPWRRKSRLRPRTPRRQALLVSLVERATARQGHRSMPALMPLLVTMTLDDGFLRRWSGQIMSGQGLGVRSWCTYSLVRSGPTASRRFVQVSA